MIFGCGMNVAIFSVIGNGGNGSGDGGGAAAAVLVVAVVVVVFIFGQLMCLLIRNNIKKVLSSASRKHAYIILTPLNPTFI